MNRFYSLLSNWQSVLNCTPSDYLADSATACKHTGVIFVPLRHYSFKELLLPLLCVTTVTLWASARIAASQTFLIAMSRHCTSNCRPSADRVTIHVTVQQHATHR